MPRARSWKVRKYSSVAKALKAAKRLANKLHRPVKVLVSNSLPRYPRKLASKYIRQEFKTQRRKARKRPRKQVVAIGISRARRAQRKKHAKRRNPQWLSGAMPRKLQTGQWITKFYDSDRNIKAELFEETNKSPKLLTYGPGSSG